MNQPSPSPKPNDCIACLSACLAAAIDLHARLKHAHWNVVGPSFFSTHKLFDKLAASAEGYADILGEQIRFLDTEANGTVKSAAANSFLGPYTVGIAAAPLHLAAIDKSFNTFNAYLLKGIRTSLTAQDQVTADVFIELSRGVSKDIYLVRSHLRT